MANPIIDLAKDRIVLNIYMKMKPLRCSICGRFVSRKNVLAHDSVCPNWKPTFIAEPKIPWDIRYTNPCGEEPLE